MDRQIYDRMRLIEDRHWWFAARRKILAGLIAGLPLPPQPQVLEVGCGTGGNLAMLKQFGAVTALEPDAESRAYAAQRAGVTVHGGFLPHDLAFEPGTFDLVCAFDVIEHVDDDAGTVKALEGLLRPGGWLVTTVPGQPWMWGRHDELHHHKRRYRLGPYRALFEAAGLEVQKASYFNTALFAPIAAVRALKMLTGSKAADDDAMPAAPVNRLFEGLFSAELSWLKRGDLPIGVSILLIARKARP